MYEKNLSEDLRLRLSENDMNFLRELSQKRACTVSEVIRSIIGEYRRSIDTVNALSEAIKVVSQMKGDAVHGDTETYINN